MNVVGLSVLLVALSGAPPAGKKVEAKKGEVLKVAGNLELTAPAGWSKETPSSEMRQAQWKIAPAAGDGEGAEAVIFWFGAGQGGNAQANIDRWLAGFEPAGGKSPKDAAQVTKKTIGKLEVTRVDISGRYVAPVRPGSPDRNDKPGWRMLAAVIESPGGPHFVKLTGPEKTVAAQSAAFDALLASAKTSP